MLLKKVQIGMSWQQKKEEIKIEILEELCLRDLKLSRSNLSG
jgi:hypothetical protein